MGATAVRPAGQPAAEARERVRRLERLRADMTARIAAERREGPPDRGRLEAAIREAEGEIARLETLIDRARTHAKTRKREISHWKLWYNAQPAIDKCAQLKQLDTEVAWRAADIAAREGEIQALFVAQVEARGRCEAAKVRLAALDAGVLGLPAGQDPRLKALADACACARSELAALTPRRPRAKTAAGKSPAGRPTAAKKKPAKGGAPGRRKATGK